MAGQPSARTEHFATTAQQPKKTAQDYSMEEAYDLGLLNGPNPPQAPQSSKEGIIPRDTCRGEAPGLANEG